MELEGDFSLTIPLVFTALAVILATLWVKLRSAGEKQPAEESHEEVAKERVTEILEEEQKDKGDHAVEEEVCERTDTGTVSVEEVGAAGELIETKESETDAAECDEKATTPSSQSSQEEDDSKEEDVETESDKILKISEADDADDEEFSFKYVPGKLRGSDFEKMLTKDELEEEQRTEDKKLSLQSS